MWKTGTGRLEMVTLLIIKDHERLGVNDPHGPGLSKICVSHSCKTIFFGFKMINSQTFENNGRIDCELQSPRIISGFEKHVNRDCTFVSQPPRPE